MILGANLVQKRNEIDSRPPTNCLPIQAHPSEFGGLWTLIAIRHDCSDGDYAGVNEGKNEVSRCHFPHEFIERVPRSVGVALRRPEITALDLLPICLVLVYPPVAHVASILPEIAFRRPQLLHFGGRRFGIGEINRHSVHPSTLVVLA
jgi:hypothetical protein